MKNVIDGGYRNPVIETLKLSSYARLPMRANPTDAGADVFAIDECTILQPGQQKTVGLGIAIKVRPGYVALLDVRSSMRAKGLTSLGPGYIDPDYRGELKIVLQNTSEAPYEINKGDRIGQIIILPTVICDFVDIWNDTERGEGGFGSTGI